MRVVVVAALVGLVGSSDGAAAESYDHQACETLVRTLAVCRHDPKDVLIPDRYSPRRASAVRNSGALARIGACYLDFNWAGFDEDCAKRAKLSRAAVAAKYCHVFTQCETYTSDWVRRPQ